MEDGKVMLYRIPDCDDRQADLLEKIVKTANDNLAATGRGAEAGFHEVGFIRNTEDAIDSLVNYVVEGGELDDIRDGFLTDPPMVLCSSKEAQKEFEKTLDDARNGRRQEFNDREIKQTAEQIKNNINELYFKKGIGQRGEILQTYDEAKSNVKMVATSLSAAYLANEAADMGITVRVADNRESGDATLAFESEADFFKAFTKDDINGNTSLYAHMIAAQNSGLSKEEERNMADILMKKEKSPSDEQMIADFKAKIQVQAEEIMNTMERTNNDPLLAEETSTGKSFSQVSFAEEHGIRTIFNKAEESSKNIKAAVYLFAEKYGVMKISDQKVQCDEVLRRSIDRIKAKKERLMAELEVGDDDELKRRRENELRTQQDQREEKLRKEEERRRLEEEQRKLEEERAKKEERIMRSAIALMMMGIGRAHLVKSIMALEATQEMVPGLKKATLECRAASAIAAGRVPEITTGAASIADPNRAQRESGQPQRNVPSGMTI